MYVVTVYATDGPKVTTLLEETLKLDPHTVFDDQQTGKWKTLKCGNRSTEVRRQAICQGLMLY